MGNKSSKIKNMQKPENEFADANRFQVATNDTTQQNNISEMSTASVEVEQTTEKVQVAASMPDTPSVPVKMSDSAEQVTPVPSTVSVDLVLPAWLNEEFFHEILKEHYDLPTTEYSVISLSSKLATAKGDNYASVMYRSSLQIELTNQTLRKFSFIVKCLPDKGMTEEFLTMFNVFPKEVAMYSQILPEFEKMLAGHDIHVKFGPKCLKAVLKHPTDVIVLEDLTDRDYRMVDRHIGLNMEHTKAILKKMALFHSISAVHYEKHGNYDECFKNGIYNEKLRPMMEQHIGASQKTLISIINDWPFGAKYAKIFEQNSVDPTKAIDALFACVKVNENDFNVLNHGDMWCNNMMFTYDADNQLQDALLLDFQMSYYGSPIMDLCYFLFSSTEFEIKFTEFEYFLQYYHEHLISNLTKFGYEKRMPKLNELHIEFYKRGYFATTLSFGLLAIVLLEATDDASIENMMKDDEVGRNFKLKMYNNPLYVRQMEVLLPYMDRRGLLTI